MKKLQDYLAKNWRTTLMGLLGAVAVATTDCLQSGHPTFKGIGIAALLAAVGAISRDAKQAHLGVIDELILQHGLGAVSDYLQKAAKVPNTTEVKENR